MTHETPPPDHPTEMPADHDARLSDGPAVNVDDVKQGRRGLHILWVLLISLGLIVVIFGIIYVVQAPGLSQTQVEADARSMPAELQPQPDAPR
ncbi:hypothetical protein [uncultured Brevundimonas sp.]|uniref:hypothetical protein n=1 Tax=uncultured Brevundimonas sp. TaxID=213418 RepID=UPI0030EE2D7D|tara:strand:- start:76916 stop:77194 length:279 start_codon:yes stop_codon:yes gene_type:complete